MIRTAVMAAMAGAVLVLGGCQNSSDTDEVAWSEQPGETSSAPVTGKEITAEEGTGGGGDEGACGEEQIASGKCAQVKE